ncbi:hypothetical protein [Candidatus Halobonum tyrrellensis]|uniref:Uncharacterized protein n=1 Tax=Candidatus Halobonum tyrrellensis G22 TaxID=1324957 RepID=V4HEA3_9EURY|nr:hypothetical protein [Candidatus Halobonum tyrrellensis]ESP89015.1 hypothetical protein K933_06183 [Candidatus Halobonum tyrrellensis G22]
MTEGRDEGATMADVRHTHPETGETFGAVYRRGPAVADGGATRERDRGSDGASDGTVADVDHEPPYPDPADVWARGGERSGADRGDDT